MKLKRKNKSFFLHRLKSKHHPLLFRRLAFLWIFLIILEIGCPLLECRDFAGDLTVNNSTVSSTIVLTDVSALSESSAGADTDHRSQTEDCNDECLCHITPVKALVFEMPKYALHTSVSPISLKFQPSSDLPPPYQPPQFS